MNGLGRAAAYVALFSEIGIVLLITVLVGTLVGYWADQQLRTIPVFALIGFLVGMTAGAIGCWRLMARFLARLDESERR